MIAFVSLTLPGAAEIIELARMLLARKLVPGDRRATLSPMVNAPLAQCLVLNPGTAAALADWAPRLGALYLQEMADRDADPSLPAFLDALPDGAARENLIRQFFLPFQPRLPLDTGTPAATAAGFAPETALALPMPDMGPLYPVMPENGALVLPAPFAATIFDQILMGRHSRLHLETRRRGQTDAAASDRVIRASLDMLAKLAAPGQVMPPFHGPVLRMQDLSKSRAYVEMMSLGFSRDEMRDALAPWTLAD